jgi:hypothetical protein
MSDASDGVVAGPSPDAEYWTSADVAAYLGVKVSTVRIYRTRAAANRKAGTPQPGDLPEEDRVFARSPVWRPARIIVWDEQDRPGRGVGGGRPPKT